MEDYSLQDRQNIERFLDVVDLTAVMRRAREEAVGNRWLGRQLRSLFLDKTGASVGLLLMLMEGNGKFKMVKS